jgi:hypothetical protein
MKLEINENSDNFKIDISISKDEKVNKIRNKIFTDKFSLTIYNFEIPLSIKIGLPETIIINLTNNIIYDKFNGNDNTIRLIIGNKLLALLIINTPNISANNDKSEKLKKLMPIFN